MHQVLYQNRRSDDRQNLKHHSIMKEKIRIVSSWMRMALLGGALIVAGSSVAFNRLVHAKDQPSGAQVRLIVDDAPALKDSRGAMSFAPVVKHVAPSVVKVFTT